MIRATTRAPSLIQGARQTGPFPLLSVPVYKDGKLHHLPQWMNARNYSEFILPPHLPSPQYIAAVFDVPHDWSHTVPPPSSGLFPHQPDQNNLAQIGLRAQRRYRISSEQWRGRWAP